MDSEQQTTDMTAGQLLLIWIKEHCGTVSNFADDIGFPRTTVRHWVHDDCSIRPINLAIVSEYFAEVMNVHPMTIYIKLVLADKHIQQVAQVWEQKQQKEQRCQNT